MLLDRPVLAPARLQVAGQLDEILIRICIALQLTRTQYELAAEHYGAVAKWLSAGGPLAAILQDIFPQGSLRIGTTVRPWLREEYDLDLVLWLDLAEIDPLQLLILVEQRLRAHSDYDKRVERKNRCLRLNYAGQFHLDILPARPDRRMGGTNLLVPDRAARCWKESNPKGYASWFDARGEEVRVYLEPRAAASVEPLPLPEEVREKNALQLAVQLLKRWRDLRFAETPELAPISIVLTTLCGLHYGGEAHPFEALCAIVRGINQSIPAIGRLRVLNPTNPFEDLSERWDREPLAYRAFVRAMGELERDLALLAERRGRDVAPALETLFGAAPVRSAFEGYGRALLAAREAGALAVTSTGAITSIHSGRTSSAPAVVIKPHTFYGE